MPVKRGLGLRFYRVTIRLTPEMRDWVFSRAAEENMPVAMFIRKVLRDAMRGEAGRA